ncbi:MAG TPA: hypothetical protein VHN15_02630, partial [Thermoanaerobaculia bacterium]|nr:hypothetical protein [Thermoanaerobaculia bacterium]
MDTVPFAVRSELEGWELFWVLLEGVPGHEQDLATLRRSVSERTRSALSLETLSSVPTVAALRRLFKAAGCDPGRYRPSSEALPLEHPPQEGLRRGTVPAWIAPGRLE